MQGNGGESRSGTVLSVWREGAAPMSHPPNESWRDIRPVALGLVTRGHELLVFEYYDETADETFYRPPGGGIQFGEAASDAIEREFAEELGWDVTTGERLGVLENRFTFDGIEGHEYAFCYAVEPSDETVYEREEFVATETDGDEYRLCWHALGSFNGDGPPLYPDGLLSVVAEYPQRWSSSSAAATSIGRNTVASPTMVALRASFSNLPHERASSSVAPESPPVASGSIVIWTP